MNHPEIVEEFKDLFCPNTIRPLVFLPTKKESYFINLLDGDMIEHIKEECWEISEIPYYARILDFIGSTYGCESLSTIIREGYEITPLGEDSTTIALSIQFVKVDFFAPGVFESALVDMLESKMFYRYLPVDHKFPDTDEATIVTSEHNPYYYSYSFSKTPAINIIYDWGMCLTAKRAMASFAEHHEIPFVTLYEDHEFKIPLTKYTYNFVERHRTEGPNPMVQLHRALERDLQQHISKLTSNDSELYYYVKGPGKLSDNAFNYDMSKSIWFPAYRRDKLREMGVGFFIAIDRDLISIVYPENSFDMNPLYGILQQHKRFIATKKELEEKGSRYDNHI